MLVVGRLVALVLVFVRPDLPLSFSRGRRMVIARSSVNLSRLKNDEFCSAVPKPGDEISAQMPVRRTQEFPSFTASCSHKVLPLLGWFTIYCDLLHWQLLIHHCDTSGPSSVKTYAVDYAKGQRTKNCDVVNAA